MPVISITMRRGRASAQKQAIIDGLRTALADAFQMSDDSYSIRISEYNDTDFFLPYPKTEGYILVEMDCFPGRTGTQKQMFSQLLFTQLAQIGEDPKQVLSLIREIPLENWGYAGK